MIWTSPTGHTYTTKPGGSLFFPALAVPTGTLRLPTWTPSATANRGLMVPARRRTRADDRAARNSWERGINEARIAAEAAREAARAAAVTAQIIIEVNLRGNPEPSVRAEVADMAAVTDEVTTRADRVVAAVREEISR